MAIYHKNPFPEITDYSQYQNWQKVVLPSGETYYVVPGHPGYVYDPVASNASGNTVFKVNPQQAIDATQKQQAQQDAALKQQQFNQSPLGQALPVAGQVGGTLASLYGAKQIGVFGNASTPAAAAAQAGTTAGTTATTAAAASPAANAAAQGAVPIGSSIDGGTLMSDGTVVPAGIGITPYLGVAGAGLGAYGLYNAIQGNNVGQGALSGAGIGLGLGAAAPLVGLGPVGWAGLAGLAAAGALGGGGLTGLLGKKSTKEIETDRWKSAGVSPDVAQSMAGHDYFAGTLGEQSRDEKYLTPDAIRLNPDNYHNVPDWDSWSKPQQDQFLSTLLAEGKVQEKKGGIYYDDARAKQLADQIRKQSPGMNISTPGQAAAQGAVTNLPLHGGPTLTLTGATPVPRAPMMRSRTLSPGIGLNGQPISY